MEPQIDSSILTVHKLRQLLYGINCSETVNQLSLQIDDAYALLPNLRACVCVDTSTNVNSFVYMLACTCENEIRQK